jgi:hypothetical protein
MDDPNLIETIPTKELFVHVLTRDIRLDDAVLDLVDNCIDGAKRLHPENDARFEDRWVKIAFGAGKFLIEDNCGGIDVDLARNYAFRFGRDKNMHKTPNSIGQFGVGMKRALLRFGRHFEVLSVSEKNFFRVVVDVDDWLRKDDWHFKFDEEVPGTRIVVRNLTEDAEARFPVEEFEIALRNQLEKNAQQYLNRGLAIEVNGKPILARPFEIIFNNDIVPGKKVKIYNGSTEAPVTAEFFAGVGSSSPLDAGWSIACNGRIILSADQSKLTGWDTIADDGVPKYHNQFSRFRGYVQFSCADASRLPWNTMKTGVNPDSPIYQDARREMITLMRPVIDFLNRLDKENEEPEDERPLTALVQSAAKGAFTAAKYESVFRVAAPARPPKPRTVSIQFRRPKSEADELVEAIGANSARNAAELAWEEAYERYVENQ